MTFPRYRNGHVDTGVPLQASNRRKRCPNCDSSDYLETVSREHCRSCGLSCDYWGGGANTVYNDYLDARHASEAQDASEEQDV